MSNLGGVGSKPVTNSQTAQKVTTLPNSAMRRLAVISGHLTQTAPESAPSPKQPKPLRDRIIDTHKKVSTPPPKLSASGVTQKYARVVDQNSVLIGSQQITLARHDTLESLWKTYNSDAEKTKGKDKPEPTMVTILLTDIGPGGTSKEMSVPVEKALMLRQAINDYSQVQTKRIEVGVKTDHDPSLPSKTEFDKECTHLVGKNYLPGVEELRLGWNILENAKGTSFLTFGLTRDVNDTIAFGHGGYTSETNKGAVFMPREWTLFLNDCWVMGGIKGEVPFTGITLFDHIGGGESTDFSSKDKTPPKPTITFEGELEVPSLFIVTVSVAEITALREAGYKPVPDETFGVRFEPDPSLSEHRRNLTFSDLSELRARCVLTQAAEHITGDYAQVRSLLEFVKQEKQTDRQLYVAQEKLKAIYNPSSISHDHSGNAIGRLQIKMHNAARELRLVTESSPLDPMKAISLAPPHLEGPHSLEQQDRAWQELQHSGVKILEKVMAMAPEGMSAIPDESVRLLKLEFLRQTEEARMRIERYPEEPFKYATTDSIIQFFVSNEEAWTGKSETEQYGMMAFLAEGIPERTKEFTKAIDSEPVRKALNHLADQRDYTTAQRKYTFEAFDTQALRRFQRGDLTLDAIDREPDRFFSEYHPQSKL